jgi:hypothetical protein
MINRDSLTSDWINKVSKANRNADRILVEKVIRALLLLEGLVKQELPFVFKGGTALMLLMDSSKRLSIDIDIILPTEPEDLQKIFNRVAEEQGFLKAELQHRKTDSKIKKAHYKFFYTPVHKSMAAEEGILLDILFEEVNYKKVNLLPITSSFVITSSNPLKVSIPSLEDILGDKLTAFAPNTTGIPYFKKGDSMSMEIIKQLYDIGNLFAVVNDAELIRSTFSKFVKTELAYLDHSILNENDVVEDIYETSLCICLRGGDGKGDFVQLQLGIQRVSGFIFSESYHLEKVITHASKAAYLTTIIKHNSKRIEKFEPNKILEDWKIETPMNTKLNKLKKTNPEAFFYWYKIYELNIAANDTTISF